MMGPLHADFIQAHNEASCRGDWNFNGFWRLPPWPPAATDTRVKTQSPVTAAFGWKRASPRFCVWAFTGPREFGSLCQP
jgi:hypothetical protein